jgi:hypothetical protein
MLKVLNQKGQALLIVVLAMVVALTVGLSVFSRSVINLKNSQQQANSQQALSAAEAGVQQAIGNGTGVAQGQFSASNFYASSTIVSGAAEFLLNGNNKVSKDDAMYIWLTPYSSDPTKLFQDANVWTGNLKIYWGDSTTGCNNAALEIVVISGSRATPVVSRYAYDPCSGTAGNRNASNHFDSPSLVNVDHPISGITLYNAVNISVTNGFIARVIPLYTDAYIGVLGTNTPPSPVLPSQGSIIVSKGTIVPPNSLPNSTSNSVVKKLNVFQGFPEVPAELFPFTLFWP